MKDFFLCMIQFKKHAKLAYCLKMAEHKFQSHGPLINELLLEIWTGE